MKIFGGMGDWGEEGSWGDVGWRCWDFVNSVKVLGRFFFGGRF